MNSKTFKAHPVMIMRLMKPYLFVLILPFVRAMVQYFTINELKLILPFEIVVLGIVLVFAIMGWITTSVSINRERIIIKRGVLLRICSCIDLSNISSVTITQNMIDLVVGSAGFSVNTEAGTPKKDDFYLKLWSNDAKTLHSIIYDDENKETIKFSYLRIALLAAATSSATTGIFVGVPIINHVSNLVGIALSEVLFNEISHISLEIDSLFPPIVNMITIVFFVSYGVSFIVVLIKNANFRLKIGKNVIEVQSGLFVRRKTVLKKANINDVCIEQTPLMRFVKKYSMRVSLGGYGNKKGTSAVIIPVAAQKDLKDYLKTHFSFFEYSGSGTKPKRTILNLNRLLFAPAVIALVIIGATAVLMIILPQLARLVLFLSFVAMCTDVYYGSVCYQHYKRGQVCIANNIYISGTSGMTIRELYCNKNNIGIIRLTETPADCRFGSCKIKLIVRSEDADTVKVKNICKKEVVKQISREFGLNINE